MTQIPGYTFGTSSIARSPITLEELRQLEATLLFGEGDVSALRASKDILRDQTDAILDVWYGFVGSQPHLLATFVDARTGQPSGAYLDAVRKRFGQWILDTAAAEHDQRWLDWQHEIAIRHHRIKKNVTDGASASAIVPFRFLAPLVIPVTTTLRPFLATQDHPATVVDAMHAAWVKSVLLQVTLWSQPYVKDGDY